MTSFCVRGMYNFGDAGFTSAKCIGCLYNLGGRFDFNKTSRRLVEDRRRRFDFHRTCRGLYNFREAGLTSAKRVGILYNFGVWPF